MADQSPVDLNKRDPNDLNSHVKVLFEEVLGEPEGVRSMDCVWINSYKCFECGKNLCYKLMTTLCGICIALYWGCEFAMITFQTVWCCTPAMRMFQIVFGCCNKFLKSVMACCVEPCCESCGTLFSNIRISK